MPSLRNVLCASTVIATLASNVIAIDEAHAAPPPAVGVPAPVGMPVPPALATPSPMPAAPQAPVAALPVLALPVPGAPKAAPQPPPEVRV